MAATIQLAQAFGGTRLYVPQAMHAGHEIVQAIGPDAARRLAERFSPDVIRVPLARQLRAEHYRAQGSSYAEIARRLGITESGVDRMFSRLRSQG